MRWWGKKREYQAAAETGVLQNLGSRAKFRSLPDPRGGELLALTLGGRFFQSLEALMRTPGFLGSLLPTVVPISVRLYKSGVAWPNKKEKPCRREC